MRGEHELSSTYRRIDHENEPPSQPEQDVKANE